MISTYFNISAFEKIIIPTSTNVISVPFIFPCPDIKNHVKVYRDTDGTFSGMVDLDVTPDMVTGDSATSVKNGITITFKTAITAGTYYVAVEFYNDMSYALQKAGVNTTYYLEAQIALIFTMLGLFEEKTAHMVSVDEIDFIQKPLKFESNAILKWNKAEKFIENLSFADKEEPIMAGDQWVVARDEKGLVVTGVKVADLIAVLGFLDSGDVGDFLMKTKNRNGDEIAECEFRPFKMENITDLDLSETKNDSMLSLIDGNFQMKKHDSTMFFPTKNDLTTPIYDLNSYEPRKAIYNFSISEWKKEYRIFCFKNLPENPANKKTVINIFNVGIIPLECVSEFEICFTDPEIDDSVLLKDAFTINFFKTADNSQPIFTTNGQFEEFDNTMIIGFKLIFNSAGLLQFFKYGGVVGDEGRLIREKSITFPAQIDNNLPIFDINNYGQRIGEYNLSLTDKYFSNYFIFCVDKDTPDLLTAVFKTKINIFNIEKIAIDCFSSFDLTVFGLEGNQFLYSAFEFHFYEGSDKTSRLIRSFVPDENNQGGNPICYSLVFSNSDLIKINDLTNKSVNGLSIYNFLDRDNPLNNILSAVNPENKKIILRYNGNELIAKNFICYPNQIDNTKPINDFANYQTRIADYSFNIANIKFLELDFACVCNIGVGGAGEYLSEVNFYNIGLIPENKVFVFNFVIYQGTDLITDLNKAFTFNFFEGVDKTSQLLFSTNGEEYYVDEGKISTRITLNKYGATEFLKYGSGNGGGGGNFVTQTQLNQSVAQINQNIIVTADNTLLQANDYTDSQIAIYGSKETWINPTMPIAVWGSDNNIVKYVVDKKLAIWVGVYTTVGIVDRAMTYKIDTRPINNWDNGEFYHLRIYVEVKRGDFFGNLGAKFRVVDENNNVIVGNIDIVDRTDGGIAGVNGLILFSRVNGTTIIKALPFSTFVNNSDPLVPDLDGYLTKVDADLIYAKIVDVYSRVEADATFLKKVDFETYEGVVQGEIDNLQNQIDNLDPATVVNAETIVNLSEENVTKTARLKLNDDKTKFFVEVDGGGGGGTVIPNEIIDNATVLVNGLKFYDWEYNNSSANLSWLDKKNFTNAELLLFKNDFPRPTYVLEKGKNIVLKNLEFYALRHLNFHYSNVKYSQEYFNKFGIIIDNSNLDEKFICANWENILVGAGRIDVNNLNFPTYTSLLGYKMLASSCIVGHEGWFGFFYRNNLVFNLQSVMFTIPIANGINDNQKYIGYGQNNQLFINNQGWYFGAGNIKNIVPAQQNYAVDNQNFPITNDMDGKVVCISMVSGIGLGVTSIGNTINLVSTSLTNEIEIILRFMVQNYQNRIVKFNGSASKTINHPYTKDLIVYDFPCKVSATKITWLTEPSFEIQLIESVINNVTNITNQITQNSVTKISSRSQLFIPEMAGDFEIDGFKIFSQQEGILEIVLNDDDLESDKIEIILDDVVYFTNGTKNIRKIDFGWASGLQAIIFVNGGITKTPDFILNLKFLIKIDGVNSFKPYGIEETPYNVIIDFFGTQSEILQISQEDVGKYWEIDCLVDFKATEIEEFLRIVKNSSSLNYSVLKSKLNTDRVYLNPNNQREILIKLNSFDLLLKKVVVELDGGIFIPFFEAGINSIDFVLDDDVVVNDFAGQTININLIDKNQIIWPFYSNRNGSLGGVAYLNYRILNKASDLDPEFFRIDYQLTFSENPDIYGFNVFGSSNSRLNPSIAKEREPSGVVNNVVLYKPDDFFDDIVYRIKFEDLIYEKSSYVSYFYVKFNDTNYSFNTPFKGSCLKLMIKMPIYLNEFDGFDLNEFVGLEVNGNLIFAGTLGEFMGYGLGASVFRWWSIKGVNDKLNVVSYGISEFQNDTISGAKEMYDSSVVTGLSLFGNPSFEYYAMPFLTVNAVGRYFNEGIGFCYFNMPVGIASSDFINNGNRIVGELQNRYFYLKSINFIVDKLNLTSSLDIPIDFSDVKKVRLETSGFYYARIIYLKEEWIKDSSPLKQDYIDQRLIDVTSDFEFTVNIGDWFSEKVKFKSDGQKFLNDEIVICFNPVSKIVYWNSSRYGESANVEAELTDLQNQISNIKPIKPAIVTAPTLDLYNCSMQTYNGTVLAGLFDNIPSMKVVVTITKNSNIIVPLKVFGGLNDESFVFALQRLNSASFGIIVEVQIAGNVTEFSVEFESGATLNPSMRSFYNFSDADYNNLTQDEKDNFSFGIGEAPRLAIYTSGTQLPTFNPSSQPFVQDGNIFGVKSDKNIFASLKLDKVIFVAT